MDTMQRTSTLLSILATIAYVSTAASAQVLNPSTPTCPARYELLSGSCFNATNGDVVLAEVKVAAPVLARARAQCRPGYDIMVNALCVSGKTGDVVYADMIPGVQTANK